MKPLCEMSDAEWAREYPLCEGSMFLASETSNAALQRLTSLICSIEDHESVSIYPRGEHVVAIEEWDGRPVHFWISRLDATKRLTAAQEDTVWYALPALRPPMVRRPWNLAPTPCACKVVKFRGLMPVVSSAPGSMRPKGAFRVKGIAQWVVPSRCPFCQGSPSGQCLVSVAAAIAAQVKTELSPELLDRARSQGVAAVNPWKETPAPAKSKPTTKWSPFAKKGKA